MTDSIKPSKEQMLAFLGKLKAGEAEPLLGLTDKSVQMMRNIRKIGPENQEKILAAMQKKGIKILPQAGASTEPEAPLSPNAIVQATIKPAVTPAPKEIGAVPPSPSTASKTLLADEIRAAEEILKELEILDPAPLSEQPHAEESIPPSITVNDELLPEGRKLMICFPCYRQTNPATMMSIMGLYDRTKMMFALQHGTVLINARNRLTETFLRSGCEWSFWLDDDMVVPFGNEESYRALTGLQPKYLAVYGARLNTINRLFTTAKTRNLKIVSGLYFGRNAQGRAMFAEGIASKAHDNDARMSAGKDIVRNTQWAAAGCLLIHRDVFIKIAQDNPKSGKVYPFWTPEGTEGEDRSLGVKAARSGFQAVVDHAVLGCHMGYAIYNHLNTEWKENTL